MSAGICRICGSVGTGQSFDDWVRDTFTNYDLLHPGEIICEDCQFWFVQKSVDLQQRMGKDKPQKMQNYSHFVIGGDWFPVSKGDKSLMTRLLLTPPFPCLAAIATSGQKHIAFRARRNLSDQAAGWVQFEEAAIWVDPKYLAVLLQTIESLYAVFSKDEIGSGNYFSHRIMIFGMDRWYELEQRIKPVRQTGLFQLALFLAQRSDDECDKQRDGGDAA